MCRMQQARAKRNDVCQLSTIKRARINRRAEKRPPSDVGETSLCLFFGANLRWKERRKKGREEEENSQCN